MAHPISFIKGLYLGAGAIYLLDPQRGRRRRSLLRDQCVHYCHKASRATDVVRRDVGNRMYGAVAEFRGALRRDEPSSETLVARVRAEIGRHVAHASSISVEAVDGRVTLFGSAPAHQAQDLIAAVHRIRGVKQVHSALRLQDQTADNMSSPSESFAHRRRSPHRGSGEYWSPALRAVAGAAGLGLMANCLARRTPAAIMLGTLGFGLATRAATNLELQRLFGASRSRRGIDFQTGIVIEAPIQRVFDLLSTPENYSRLTDVITSVQNLGEGRYHKSVRVPGGSEVLLAERIIARRSNEMVAWRSESESFLPYAGAAWFKRIDDNRTDVQICMSYNPPGGMLSHAAATLLQMNPKALIDDLLMRAKQYAESGPQPRDAAQRAAPSMAGGPEVNAPGESPKPSEILPRIERASSPAQAGEPVIHNL
ncbi:MAG: BON domain-containing protein [Pirellulales bacterium]|nr:BON domain-containing protein [Pirellulales bacterium]